jgi:hypothetical protein
MIAPNLSKEPKSCVAHQLVLLSGHDQAKEEALEKAKVAVAELNAPGLNYVLSNGAGKSAKTGPAKGQRTIKAEACPICEFQTSPPHDGRTHRSQKRKAAFSAAELKEKGLVKV